MAAGQPGNDRHMILAETYLARYGTPFQAYMELQRSLLCHFLSRGGTPEAWCERVAPAFHRRYGGLLEAEFRTPVAAGC